MNNCATCARPLQSGAAFCSNCGAATPAASIPAPPPQPGFKLSAGAKFLGGLVLLGLVVIVGLVVSGNGSLPEPAAQPANADYPPSGDIWFGSSFDVDTLEVRGRTSTVGINEPLAIVASLTSPVHGADLAMRVYLDGELVTNTAAGAEDMTSDVWGWSVGPLSVAGTWRYEITDIGGNVLASGEISAS